MDEEFTAAGVKIEGRDHCWKEAVKIDSSDPVSTKKDIREDLSCTSKCRGVVCSYALRSNFFPTGSV